MADVDDPPRKKMLRRLKKLDSDSRARRWIVTTVALTFLAGCAEQNRPNLKTQDIDQVETSIPSTPEILDPLEQIQTDLKGGKIQLASERIRSLMITRSDDDVLILAARVAAEEGRTADAITLAGSVVKRGKHVIQANRAIAQIADRHRDSVSLDQLPLVWAAMESTLKSTPERHDLRSTLIQLLNRFGYRHRACQHLDWLCSAGVASGEQLRGLIVRRSSFPVPSDQDPQPLQVAQTDGRLALARSAYSSHQFSNAFQILLPESKLHSIGNQTPDWPHPEYAALFGQVLAESQRFDLMSQWLGGCPEQSRTYAEFWSALGIWLIHRKNYLDAASSLLIAIEIDPTQESDYHRLSLCLNRLGDAAAAESVKQRAQQASMTVAQAALSRSHPKSKVYLSHLSQSLNDLGRPFEYVAWQQVLGATGGAPAGFMQGLNQKRLQLLRLPDLAAMASLHRRMGFERKEFPVPSESTFQKLTRAHKDRTAEIGVSATSLSDVPTDPDQSSEFAIESVGTEIGIDFTYKNRSPPREIGFRLHETLCGGVAIIDADLDGYPDLYLGQGSGDPPHQTGDESDRFFHHQGQRYLDRTELSGLTDFGYTTGVTAGDVNQDGFPDLFVASLSENRLLINQGDGTFQEIQRPLTSEHLYTSSVAIVDVTGDHLPDLVEVNYVGGDDLFRERPLDAHGHPSGLSPLTFPPARDRLFVADPNGDFTVQDLEPANGAAANSLGLIVTEIDGETGNEIFIANDANPNRYWKRMMSQESGSRTSESEWVELGVVSGLSLDFSRIATAGMGVAEGDFDSDGMIDFHVTNFWRQFSSLYIQSEAGLFSDRAPRFGLDSLTYSTLGFGTQALDVDNNGKLDLAILNGHIEDYSSVGHSFRMKPQIFRRTETGFSTATVNETKNFWSTPTLGRALAKVDWNRDRLTDLIAIHLDTPVTCLENRTKQAGNAIEFLLIGTTSERDAIGASVTVKTQGTERRAWRVAGNGYLCSNENLIRFGLAAAETVDTVTVRWPSGREQRFGPLRADNTYVVIEGHEQVTPLD